MGRRIGLGWIGAFCLLVLGITSCSRGRDNAQVASEVQNSIRGDSRLQMARIQVRATNGVVTLSGYVGSNEQRVAIFQDAARIEGVRVVVDNLRIHDSGTANLATIKPASQGSSATWRKPSPSVIRPARHFKDPTADALPVAAPLHSPRTLTAQTISAGSSPGMASPASVVPALPVSSDTPSVDSQASGANPGWPAPPPAEATLPPPPEYLTLPYGTVLAVRLAETLSSDFNEKGDTFAASLASPIMIEDRVVIPAEAGIQGKVVEVQNAGRFSGRSALVIEVTRLAYNGQTYELRSDQFSKQGSSRTTRTVATIGGGAGVGALIGGILGGGRGAAIGAMIGAGAGTGAEASAKAAQVELPTESMVSFRLETPLSVVPSSTLQGTHSAGPDSSQDPFSSDERPVLKRRPGSPPAEPGTDNPGAPEESPPSLPGPN